MSEENYDLIVIGGGPAGYAGAIKAAQLGKKVTVVERERPGGTCLNWGCIPTKSLLKSAEYFQNFPKKAAAFGVIVPKVDFDFKAIVAKSRAAADRLAKGVEFLLKKNKITNIKGEAKFLAANKIHVQKNNSEQILSADNIIIATGAKARPLPSISYDGKQIISAREAMVLEKLPKSICIIGAGAIGVEFAYFFNALGSEVRLIEVLPQILPLEDEEVSKTLARSFKKQGIKIMTGSSVAEIKKLKTKLKIKTEGKNTEEFDSEVVLLAAGVEAVCPHGVDEIKLKRNERGGFIKVDDNYQSNIAGVYAVGDVIGAPLLAHTATFEALNAVKGIFTNEKPKRVKHFPSCTYCSPQVASVGANEQTLKAKGVDYRVGKFPFAACGKAVVAGEIDGFVKLIFGAEYGELLGAHIIGADATELIAELGLALDLEATFEEIEEMIHAHPTLSEAIMEAAANAFGSSVQM